MKKEQDKHVPTEISLHARSRLLRIAYEDGASFDLPCEYLRVFSKAASLDASLIGKEAVNIERIEPQGQYAIRIVFDDGHDTGIYSWDRLYRLGVHMEANWAEYVQRLSALGYQRQEPDQGEKHVKLLYFSWLAKKLRKEAEQVILPANVTDVKGLLPWMASRCAGLGPLFKADRLKVTVNRQFAEPFTKLQDGDEIGLVPNSPTPPATPDLV